MLFMLFICCMHWCSSDSLVGSGDAATPPTGPRAMEVVKGGVRVPAVRKTGGGSEPHVEGKGVKCVLVHVCACACVCKEA